MSISATSAIPPTSTQPATPVTQSRPVAAKPVAAPAPSPVDSDGDHDGSIGTLINVEA